MTPHDESKLPDRSHPVHQPVGDWHKRSVIVFVTVCTRDRKPLLATSEMQEAIKAAWARADHWLVGRYLLMPDHIHLFCSPGTIPPEPLSTWIAYWKRLAAFSSGGSFWQKNFWDTQLRRHESYSAKWEYVRNNPVREGLAQRPEDWPYQGEMNVLHWHD